MSTRKTYSTPFYWGGSTACPVISIDNSHATLTIRPYRGDEPVDVSRDQWSFARREDGRTILDFGHLYLKDGFRPDTLGQITLSHMREMDNDWDRQGYFY